MAKNLAKAQYGRATKKPLSEAEKRKLFDDLFKKVGDPRPTKPATPPPPTKVPVGKPKLAMGGGTGDPMTKDPNRYRMHKTGVFGKYKVKDISKEKFDRINNRLSSNINNNRLGSASAPVQQVEKEGIGKRKVSVSRVNTDIIKPKPLPQPTGYSRGGTTKKKK